MSTFHEGLNTIYEDYGGSWGSGETIVVGDGEYLQVESTENRITLSWTSSVQLSELLTLLQKETSEFTETETPDSFAQIRAADGGVEWAEGTLSEVTDFVREEAPDVLYLSLQYASLVVAWTAPGNRVRGSDAEHSEIGIVLPKMNQEVVTFLLENTASQAVRDHYLKLFSNIRQLASA